MSKPYQIFELQSVRRVQPFDLSFSHSQTINIVMRPKSCYMRPVNKGY